MSYRTSFGGAYGNGRGSPFLTRPVPTDRSFSDFFEYVDPGAVEPRGYTEVPVSGALEDEDAPDVLHAKYMGEMLKLIFPPYSISESGVTVQEVRRRVAEYLNKDSRRVRLVYKDLELRTDRHPVKKYGCKQNSEIAIVITEQLNDWGGVDNAPSSGDDSSSSASLRPHSSQSKRPRGLSTVRYRVEEIPQNRDSRRSVADSSGYLHPNGSSYHHQRRRSNSPARVVEVASTSSRRPTAPPQPTATPVPSSPRMARAPSNTPLGQVQKLQDQFYDKWLPESRDFLASPPSDKMQRDREYMTLSESIMKDIIMAADAIELNGDQDARAERKRVLKDAQDVLNKLDATKSAS